MRKYDLISALSEETAKRKLEEISEHRIKALQIPVQRPAPYLCPKTGCYSLCFYRDME